MFTERCGTECFFLYFLCFLNFLYFPSLSFPSVCPCTFFLHPLRFY